LEPLLLLALSFELVLASLFFISRLLLRRRLKNVGPQPMFYHLFRRDFSELVVHRRLCG
jgi:hypothetical protein